MPLCFSTNFDHCFDITAFFYRDTLRYAFFNEVELQIGSDSFRVGQISTKKKQILKVCRLLVVIMRALATCVQRLQ